MTASAPQPGKRGGAPTPENKQWMAVKDAIANASKLYSSGKLVEAERLVRQIIKSRPNNADAHNILGVTLHRQGKTDEALKALRNAIRLNGSNANYYSNLGEMERKSGNIDTAITALRRAIALDPKSAQALNNLGIACYDKRDFEGAAESYRAAIKIDGNYAEAHNNLGNALRALGKIDDAVSEYERAIEVRGNYAEAYNNMGTALRDMGKLEEAEMAYRRAMSLRPNYLEAGNNLAGLLGYHKRHEDALRIMGDLLKVYPNDVGTLIGVARAQMMRGSFPLAERAARQAVKCNPKNADALCVLGQVCHELDHYEEACKAFEDALAIAPEHIEAINFYGIVLKSLGRMEDARNMFKKALELQPRAMGAYSNIVDLEQFTEDNPLFIAMNGILEKAKDPQEERFTALHFALGKANDDIGHYEKALEHYSIGARLKRAALKYDEQEVAKFFDDIRATFNEEWFKNKPYPGNPSTLPLFIIGMPRSGSTLTEQIISAHPDVYGAGEIKTLSICLGQLRQRFPNLPKFPMMAAAMKPGHFATVADAYLAALVGMSDSALRITDKLLTNYYFTGVIHTLFPNAKIIHTLRNPIDTCLSSFTKLFKDDMPHSYDFGELGRYYCKYEELMEHWHRVLPKGTILDVVYEDVVKNPEAKAREIVDFIGLPWNDKCLEFHTSDRPVKTASVSQVRKPIYKSAVERWKRYGDRLQPLIDALESNGKPATRGR